MLLCYVMLSKKKKGYAQCVEKKIKYILNMLVKMIKRYALCVGLIKKFAQFVGKIIIKKCSKCWKNKKDMPNVLAQWIMWRLILSAHASGHLPKLLHCLTIQDNTMSQCH